MKCLLAVDTSTEACSAALAIDGVVHERFEVAPREHSNLIISMIDELLADGGIDRSYLDALAFCRGPGSFMGIRIATGIVQGIGYAFDIPVIPVSTLATLSAQAVDGKDEGHAVLAAIDARMGEVYWAGYQAEPGNMPELISEERVTKPDAVIFEGSGLWIGAGTGWGTFADELTERAGTAIIETIPDCLPRAGTVARLGALGFSRGQAVPAEEAVPIYLRDKVAKTIAEREAD